MVETRVRDIIANLQESIVEVCNEAGSPEAHIRQDADCICADIRFIVAEALRMYRKSTR